MGREVKRVSKDFDWPMNKPWWGYVIERPAVRCQSCDGTGKNGESYCWVCDEGIATFGPIEPPWGVSYQMWETTSEGSPISPPFETPEELAQWLADTGASTFADMTATYEQWLAMIGEGSAPSMVMDSGGIKSGVEAVSHKER